MSEPRNPYYNLPSVSDVIARIIGGIVAVVLLWLFVNWALDLDEHFDKDITKSVHKCLESIESRDWDKYRATFEPSAAISPRSPGYSVRFKDVKLTNNRKAKESASVILNATIRFDEYGSEVPFNADIRLVKVKRTGILGTLGLTRWYLTADAAKALPFNFPP